MNTTVKTRESVLCDVFGAPSALPKNRLPTYGDTMKLYNQTKHKLKEQSNKEPSHKDIAEIVILDVVTIWEKSSLPRLSHKRIQDMLKTYHRKYFAMLKVPKDRRDSDTYKEKMTNFLADSDILFDISSCKCQPIESCACEKSRKVPIIEQEFLVDQRGERSMIIAGVDRLETGKQQQRYIRNEAILRQTTSSAKANSPEPSTSLSTIVEINDIDSSNDDDDMSVMSDDSDFDFEMLANTPSKPTPTRIAKGNQMRVKLPSVALACDRHGLSDRAAASITSAVLQDIGVVHEGDASHVIDRSKIRRERNKKRSRLREERDNSISGLYFDGRKDKTLVQVKKSDGKLHREVATEEHIAIISEPGSSYFGHITPTGGSSKVVTDELLKYLDERGVDKTAIQALGCDGTAVNTGTNGGIVRLFELSLKRPVNWFICQLHSNELPLRHLFAHLDGPTTGPTGFSGQIGKQLPTCEALPLVEFALIQCEMPSTLPDDLSTDQKYLYDMCNAISVGVCPVDLSLRNPGLMNHSRWLTTGNRILRLYVSTANPSDQLKELVVFIVRVYAAMWFEIKMKPSCKDGGRHVFETIKKSRYLKKDLHRVVDPVVQRNGYFAHPENLLLSMLTDARPHIRELGVRRIMKARKEAKPGEVRVFKVCC